MNSHQRAGVRPAEVWVRDLEADPSEWHLIIRSGEPIGCGRVTASRRSSIWPVKESENGPPLDQRCAECCDAIVRTLGRLPLA